VIAATQIECKFEQRENKEMSQFALRIACVVVLVSVVFAQEPQASMSAHPATVKQGDQIRLDVKLNPPPNIGGALIVYVAPQGDTSLNVNGSRGVPAGVSELNDLQVTIPADAKLGEWKVMAVRFQTANSPQHDLTISGRHLGFEVTKRETVLPTSADVRVVK
jgi:hypothetical protein